MSQRELQKYTFVAKYAGYLPDLYRRETWPEAVARCRDMMLQKYEGLQIDDIINEVYEAIKQKEILGSQRALQFGGKAVFAHSARLYNCLASYIDRPRFFQECMYLLLCGCGCGFSVQKHHINKLPNLVSERPSKIKKFVIPDSIEGWADAIGVLVYSYLDDGNEYSGYNIYFDYSLIRPAGAPLSSCSNGKAPGPKPLKICIRRIKQLLDNCVVNGQTALKSINAYDIVMHSADAVLSGGVRRSATICIFSPDDEEMAQAKTGNWRHDNPQRNRSNNSALLLRDTPKEDFVKLMQNVKEYGEPGFVWANSLELIVNPCVEISFWCYAIQQPEKYQQWLDKHSNTDPITVKPESIGLASGWQACNLSTINGSKITNGDDFYKACRNAAIIGTLQAGFTTFPYLGEISEQIIREEALLGVSITGIMEHPEICLDTKIQRQGAKIVIQTNKEIAEKIGIKSAARSTCVKPEGSASCLLGTSSGIHPHYAKRYIRRVQANKMEPMFQYFQQANPHACEDSVWSEPGTESVISFCVEVPDGSKLKNQVSALELLEIVKNTQCNWVQHGKNMDRCTQPWLNHNVSNTIIVKPDEWTDVTDYIYDNREFFCGIALLPFSGDKDYPQAPFTTIHLPHEVVSIYGDGALFVSGLIEMASSLYEDNLWLACDALLELGAKPRGRAKLDWITKCKNFADRYVDGDIKQLTYLMKDVYNWKLWLDLRRNYKNIDYTQCIEKEDCVQFEQDIACAGGQCEM